MKLPVADKGFWFSPAYWVFLALITIICLAICSCQGIEIDRTASGGDRLKVGGFAPVEFGCDGFKAGESSQDTVTGGGSGEQPANRVGGGVR